MSHAAILDFFTQLRDPKHHTNAMAITITRRSIITQEVQFIEIGQTHKTHSYVASLLV